MSRNDFLYLTAYHMWRQKEAHPTQGKSNTRTIQGSINSLVSHNQGLEPLRSSILGVEA